MNMTAENITMVDFAIRNFARKCIDHPMLERDPVCVIATLREDACEELKSNFAESAKFQKPTQNYSDKLVHKTNGRHK